MDSTTATLLIKALDGLSARSVATAQNIANANTPGYRPLRVSFEQVLADAAQRGAGAVQAVSPQIDSIPAGARDGELRLDLELATASATTQRYGGLIEVLDRQLRLQALAITGSSGRN
ncbi:MAG TPA: flagellar basal body protein [Rhizomicrobium sp.]|nr:flagellar basal body protein [Rhizomicrobium sp.]